MYTPPPYEPPEDPAELPGHIARYLSDPVEAVWHAFDLGRAAADEYVAQPGREYEPHVWAQIARYHAVLSLKGLPEHPTWDVRFRSNSGIEIEMGPFTVKVCKAVGDSPQNPGRNLARRAFFQQMDLSLFAGPHGANLFVYWRVRNGELELGLCKPKGLWDFEAEANLEWRQPIIFDPLAGLRFPDADHEDVEVALDQEEAEDSGTEGGEE